MGDPSPAIVCGGRDYDDEPLVFSALDAIHADEPISLLIEGGNRPKPNRDGTLTRKSADFLAWLWAKERGVPTHTEHARWDAHGRAAGPIRNQAMALHPSKPARCIAFPGGRGTENMIRTAELAGLRIMTPAITKNAVGE